MGSSVLGVSTGAGAAGVSVVAVGVASTGLDSAILVSKIDLIRALQLTGRSRSSLCSGSSLSGWRSGDWGSLGLGKVSV